MRKAVVFGLSLCFLLSACVQSATNLRTNESAGNATYTTKRPLADAYSIVQSNAVRCWADGANYIIAAAPPSSTRPPSIQINSSLGHLMAVVDFSDMGTDRRVDVKVGYSLGNKSRTAAWQSALEAWLADPAVDYCPKMP